MADNESIHTADEPLHAADDVPPAVRSRMRGSKLPSETWSLIDLNLWYQPVTQDAKVEHLLTRIARATVNYRDYNDGDIVEAFQEDFEGWTIAMFNKVPPEARKYFRDFIRARGVYTGTKRGEHSRQLVKLLELDPDNLPEWDDELLREIEILEPKSKAFKRKQELRNPGLQTKQPSGMLATPASQTWLPTAPTVPSRSMEPTALPLQQQPPQPQPQQSIEPADPQMAGYSTVPPGQHREPTAIPRQEQWQVPYRPATSIPPNNSHRDPYSTLPPIEISNQRLDPSKSTQFVKMYDKTSKYTGEPYDLLDDKLKIFLNVCFHTDIQPSQFHAVFPRILTGRAENYYLHFINRDDTFAMAYMKIKRHFDTEVNHSYYYTDWTTTTFNRTRVENPDKKLHEVLQMMLDKLQLCQRALGTDFSGETTLRTAVINACRGAPELEMALFKPATECEALFSDLRSSVETHVNRATSQKFLTQNDEDELFYTDRRYRFNGRGQPRSNFSYRNNVRNSRNAVRGGNRTQWKKKCFVCNREGCWSTKHTDEERRQARSQYITRCEFAGSDPGSFAAYLADYEGNDLDQDPEYSNENSDDEDKVNNNFTVQYLMDQSFLHRVTGEDVYNASSTSSTEDFTFTDRYSRWKFQGILPDTGAAQVSTAGYEQFHALKLENSTVQLDTSTAGEAIVRFGKGTSVASIGSVKLKTPIGAIRFHVLKTPTPFLLCLADMDRLGVYFDNTTDRLVNGETKVTVPIVRKWGHPWFFLNRNEAASVFLTEIELRRLHRRFGHPATNRLYTLLTKAGYEDVDHSILKEIEKFCHSCQLNSQSPRRFKFTLKDDCEFNYEIMVDVMYLSNRPVLHVVDIATAFQAGRFLPSISAKDTWEALRCLWIDTYQGPPDIITHDAGTNFASTEFRNEAKMMGITCKQVPIEAHWSIGKLERYHAPLRRAYEVINAELNTVASPDAILQMSLKAVNDTVGPNGLVPTLLVFGTYPRINKDSPPSPSTLKRAEAIQKAMKALRKAQAERQINDALNTRNGPSTEEVLALPLQSEVCVWREKEGWQGPYKVIATDGHNVTVDTVNGPVTFRSTVVKPYYRDPDNSFNPPPSDQVEDEDSVVIAATPEAQPDNPPSLYPRRRGRPRGSKNKPRQYTTAYVTKKEASAYELAVKLRAEGIITTPGAPFEESDAQEVDDLIGRGVFRFERYDASKHVGYRLFKSRMVREIKGINDKPYEKSRLVIQGYNDSEKKCILTQSPTIQRMSQRLILAIAPTLCQQGFTIDLRDITQAYPQSQSELTRTILSSLPLELKDKYPKDTIIRVIRPLYGIAEAGVHWFATYQKHHLNELDMTTSTYDPCLLIATDRDAFGVVGLQTDDTLMLATPAFAEKEEEKLQKAQFRAKPKTQLSPTISLDFNGVRLTAHGETVVLQQKGQSKRLKLVDLKATDYAQQYSEQRARGAYLASICQPEASFDLSIAAQIQQPDVEAYKKLNNRMKWQIDNQQRGLKYVPVDLATAKLFVFADGSFANNKDLSSQLGYVVILANETDNNEVLTIRGNLIHWSSTKCKRVTRSVLASEIYGMVNGFDIGICLATTLKLITERMNLPPIPLVICTDSYSLYECLVKLGTTKEKRLMIDIMSLRESYERREITEVRWVHGDDNPADAMTKSSPNSALKRFVDNNELPVRVKGAVDRTAAV